MLNSVLFYGLSAAAILSALYAMTAKNVTNSVLALVVTILCLSGLFALRHAYFIAVIQILIYAGAILILFLFAIMLIGPRSQKNSHQRIPFLKLLGILLTAGFFLAEIWIVILAARLPPGTPAGLIGTVELIGHALFSDYLFSFELVSLILLAGVIGVVHLSKKELP